MKCAADNECKFHSNLNDKLHKSNSKRKGLSNPSADRISASSFVQLEIKIIQIEKKQLVSWFLLFWIY